MAVWLQRHEASWLRESYLIWIEKRIESLIKPREVNTRDEEEVEEDVEVEHDQVDVTHCDINITHSQDGNTRAKLNLNNIPYSIAKSPPHKNLNAEKLTENFGTTNFLPALTTFLHRNFPASTITPSSCDRFDAYKQIIISLPRNE